MSSGDSCSVTVKAEGDVLLLGLDFSHFNDVDDYNLFTLSTKLLAYRMVVHNIRWMLELHKMREPKHPLVSRLLTLPVYTGEKDGENELAFLHGQAKSLAGLLCV